MGEWDTGIAVNCWSEGSSIQQCLSWCVLCHHHGFCYYWGRGQFRGAGRVGGGNLWKEMQKSFHFVAKFLDVILYIRSWCYWQISFCFVLHFFQTTVTIANWQMSFSFSHLEWIILYRIDGNRLAWGLFILLIVGFLCIQGVGWVHIYRYTIYIIHDTYIYICILHIYMYILHLAFTYTFAIHL